MTPSTSGIYGFGFGMFDGLLDESTQYARIPKGRRASIHDCSGIPPSSIPERLPEALEGRRVDDSYADAASPAFRQPMELARQDLELAVKITRKRAGSLLPMDAVAHTQLAECDLAMLAVVEDGWSVGDDLDINGLHPTAPRATVGRPPHDLPRIHPRNASGR
jgi:hypothetical protein